MLLELVMRWSNKIACCVIVGVRFPVVAWAAVLFGFDPKVEAGVHAALCNIR